MALEGPVKGGVLSYFFRLSQEGLSFLSRVQTFPGSQSSVTDPEACLPRPSRATFRCLTAGLVPAWPIVALSSEPVRHG